MAFIPSSCGKTFTNRFKVSPLSLYDRWDLPTQRKGHEAYLENLIDLQFLTQIPGDYKEPIPLPQLCAPGSLLLLPGSVPWDELPWSWGSSHINETLTWKWLYMSQAYFLFFIFYIGPEQEWCLPMPIPIPLLLLSSHHPKPSLNLQVGHWGSKGLVIEEAY